MNLCKCGCGEFAKEKNFFVNGHNNRGVKFGPPPQERIERIRLGNIKNPSRYWIGKSHSEETKNKIRIILTGKKRPPRSKEWCEKLRVSNTGKTKTLSQIQKHRFKMIGKMSGDKHWNWRGGITKNDYCLIFSDKEFKQMIKDRDGNKCLNPYCFHNSKRIAVHHINYDKQECDSMNLITLCTSCNIMANKDREWHKEWYKTIIENRWRKNSNGHCGSSQL